MLDAKLKYLVEGDLHRKDVAHYYYEHINYSLITLPDLLTDEQNAYHLFPILVGEGKRDALHDYLEQNGVGTVCYYPISPHKQECHAKEEWIIPQMSLPVTERLQTRNRAFLLDRLLTLERLSKLFN